MSEAQTIVELAAPFVAYVTPAVFLFSVVAFSEKILSFVSWLIGQARSRRYR